MFSKSIFLAAILGLSCVAASAADYYVVVPLKNKAPDIRVTLSAAALPSAKLGNSYAYNLKNHLVVIGDPLLDLSGATFQTNSQLPLGLTLGSDGLISGIPQAKSAGVPVAVAATYKGRVGQQTYTLQVGSNSEGVWSAQAPSWSAWGLANQQQVAPLATAFSTRSPGKFDEKVFFVNNTGSNGELAMSFNLSGDLSQFKILNVTKVSGYSAASAGGNCGAVINADNISTCTTVPVTLGGDPWAQSKLRFQVQYAPLQTGSHQLVITPIAQNDASAPSPLTLTSQSVFDPTGVWSTHQSSWGTWGWNAQKATGAISPTIPTLSPDRTVDKVVYLNNVGGYGQLSAGFSLSGDTDQYQVFLTRATGYGSGETTCLSGGVRTGNSISPCLVDDPGQGTGDPWAFSKLKVTIRHTPTATGTHSITLTPTTNNGTTLPSPYTFVGDVVFDPTAVWSSYQNSWAGWGWLAQKTVAAPSTTIPTISPDRTVDHVVYLNNTGGYGQLAAGLVLSGDTDQYQVFLNRASGYGPGVLACLSGGIATGNVITPCLASDPGQGGGDPWAFSKVQVTIRHKPTAAGTHTLTLTPATNNGSVMPGALTFTGAAVFDPTGVWSTYQSSWGGWGWAAQKTTGPVSTGFGSVAVGGTSQKVFYINNTGGYGKLAAGLELSGDTDQYQVQLSRARGYGPNATTCLSGGVLSGASISPCLADDPGQGGGDPWAYSKVQVAVTYKPTRSGSHALVLTPTTNNGSSLPSPITLTGVAP